jgi:hypothetical protein
MAPIKKREMTIFVKWGTNICKWSIPVRTMPAVKNEK